MTDDLLKWREEFPILQNTLYLIAHSLGPMPRGVETAMAEYTELWKTRGVRAWAEGWWDLPRTVGNKIGRIIGADDGDVVMQQNVSISQSILLSCFQPTPSKNKILVSDLEFPSVLYVYDAHARDGWHVEMLKSRDGIGIEVQDYLDAIDESTLLVPISHVLFKSAYLQDIKPIIEKAHSVGAHVILDTYQSAGTVPIDVKELNVDFVTGGSVKWLCGGAGAGYLYVRPDLQERLEPKATGWSAHEAPFSFDLPPVKYASGASRFLHGSPAVPALYSCQAGYDIIHAVGVERIREKSQRQTVYLIQLAESEGIPITSPRDPARRGGTVTLAPENAGAITKELNRREIVVDYRPGAGIRISSHFYTKDEELEMAVKEVRKILDTGAWKEHAVTGAAF